MILNNYEIKETHNDNLIEIDQNEADANNKNIIFNRWTRVEDTILVENFSLYRDLDNAPQMLLTLLNQDSECTKSLDDVEKRIKYLKLRNGNELGKDMVLQIHGGKVYIFFLLGIGYC
jgi:hypothetical protein